MTAVLDGLPRTTGRARPDVDVGTVIVGGGHSRIAMAVGLRQAGDDDWVPLELTQHRRRTRHVDPSEYEVVGRSAEHVTASDVAVVGR